jgi:hypothetical protein
MAWLIATAAACACFCGVAFGTLVPLQDAAGVEYFFGWPGAGLFATASVIAAGAIACAYFLVLHIAGRRAPSPSAEARSGEWLSPLTGLAFAVLGVLPALPGIGKYGAPAAYVFYDLRWWWAAGLAGWTVLRADAVLGGPLLAAIGRTRRGRSAARLLLLDLVLVGGALSWAIATTPNLRFTYLLHGDEPKYLRYCELWYQGGGFDISQKALFADEPLDGSPRLHRTLSGLLRASGMELRDLATDLRRFAAAPRQFGWNRVEGGNAFIRGKHGGIYQIHQPGLSAVLFPGYLIDRYLLALNAGVYGELPAELPMTTVVMLLVYAACAMALFRLLRRVLRDDLLAFAWAAIGALTLPTVAFAFQLYPELPAAVIVITVTTYALVLALPTPRAAAGIGAAAAALVWLHPRFLMLGFALALCAGLRADWTSRRWLATAFVVVLASEMAFDYWVTGSFLPTARWSVSNHGIPISMGSVPLNLIGYGFDRRWGVIPHAPILLLLAPAIALLARRSARDAAVLVIIGLALLIPASGHTIHAAGGTPGRLILAVVPLAMIPIALLVRELWPSAAARIVTVALVGLSLEAALAYNRNHWKAFGPMRDTTSSGWRPNLVFPGIRSGAPSVPNLLLFLAILACLAAAATFVYVYAARIQDRARQWTSMRWWMAPAFAIVLVLVFSTASVANSTWYDLGYMLSSSRALERAAARMVSSGRCSLCFTSRGALVDDWTRLEPNGARGVTLQPSVRAAEVVVRVHVDTAAEGIGFGRVRLDYGDGQVTPTWGIVSDATVTHTYASPGTYTITAWLQLPDGSGRADRKTITIN